MGLLLFNPATALVFLPLSIEISPSHQLDRKNCLTLAFNIRCSCLKALSYLFIYLVSETVDWIEPPEKANRPVHQQLLQFPLTAPTAPRFVSPLASRPLISMYVVREARICMVNEIILWDLGRVADLINLLLRDPANSVNLQVPNERVIHFCLINQWL